MLSPLQLCLVVRTPNPGCSISTPLLATRRLTLRWLQVLVSVSDARRIEARPRLRSMGTGGTRSGKQGASTQGFLVTPARRKRDAEKKAREEARWNRLSGPVTVTYKNSSDSDERPNPNS